MMHMYKAVQLQNLFMKFASVISMSFKWGCTGYLDPVCRISTSGHFFQIVSGSGYGQDGVSYQIFQPDSAWSFRTLINLTKGAKCERPLLGE